MTFRCRKRLSLYQVVPLPAPGVLNWEESISLRGVERLLPSSRGMGDTSLPAELQGEKGQRDGYWGTKLSGYNRYWLLSLSRGGRCGYKMRWYYWKGGTKKIKELACFETQQVTHAYLISEHDMVSEVLWFQTRKKCNEQQRRQQGSARRRS